MTTRRFSFVLWFGALAFIVAAHLSLWLVLKPTYRQLERQQVTGDLVRANDLLNQKLRSLESNTQDYAFWDDSYAYMQHPEVAQRVLADLRALGVRLKLDRSLTAKLGRHLQDEKLALAYIALGHSGDRTSRTARVAQGPQLRLRPGLLDRQTYAAGNLPRLALWARLSPPARGPSELAAGAEVRFLRCFFSVLH